MTKTSRGRTIPQQPTGPQMFQEGGEFVDEDSLFADIDEEGDGAPQDPPSPLGNERVDTAPPSDPPADPPATPTTPPVDPNIVNLDEPPAEPAEPAKPETPPAPADVELTGIEQFLTQYGVQGGMITYEDGTSTRFDELESEEQANILSSLVQNAVPSVEEKYNLDDAEIDLLNTVRESGRSVEDFINDMVDYRVKTMTAQQQMMSEDFEKMPDDAVFVRHYMANNPEATDEQIAEELVKAKELSSFGSTAATLRNAMVIQQKQAQTQKQTKEEALFSEQLEAQRAQVVQTVENMQDIAGARVTDEMKEFLLHDIMELNENKDPILMEKIFSNPDTMFKTNWFLNYGEDYINNLNAYYKKEISKARKAGYNEAVNGMPGNPTIIPGGTGRVNPSAPGQQNFTPGVNFGQEVTEEELFDLDNE